MDLIGCPAGLKLVAPPHWLPSGAKAAGPHWLSSGAETVGPHDCPVGLKLVVLTGCPAGLKLVETVLLDSSFCPHLLWKATGICGVPGLLGWGWLLKNSVENSQLLPKSSTLDACGQLSRS